MCRIFLLTMILGLTLRGQGQDNEKLLDSVSYFPRSLYSETGNKLDSMSFIWRSQLLRNFSEPKLLINQGHTVYRFTWTRSFHEVVIFRFVNSDDDAAAGTLITKTEIIDLNEQRWLFSDRKISYNIDTLAIPSETVTKLEALVSGNGFWAMKNTFMPSAVHDGAGWLFEANDETKGYKMLYRHSPGDSEKNFKEICLFLVRLTKNFDQIEVD